MYSCKKFYDPSLSSIVINELLSVNFTVAADQDGEFDDWIELFNTSSTIIDISGYYLTDNKDEITKWKIPALTSIPAKGYLIIWADNDTVQAGLHANFKLSSLGEKIFLSKPGGVIIDEVKYLSQTQELSYSRYPNGTGTFKWKNPTFSRTNDTK
jgi:hypothetical protein